jgi:hypothetical protein
MAKRRHESILKNFLEQEKIPKFTILSLLTTMVVWLVLVHFLLMDPGDGWGASAQFWISIYVVCGGGLINGSLGGAAHDRREYCGGRVAALGITLWVLTAVVLFRFRRL